MRYSIPKAIAIGLLSVLILRINGSPVDPIPHCTDGSCTDEPSAMGYIYPLHRHPPFPVKARAGGGGGRTNKPNENTGGGGGGHPNEPNSPDGPSDGSNGSGDSEGGFTNVCTKRSWPAFWRRSGCGSGPVAAPAPPAAPAIIPDPVPRAPSTRNNNNRPATGARATVPNPINIDQRTNEMRAKLAARGVQNKPYFFFSGIKFNDAAQWKIALETELAYPHGSFNSIQDVVDVRVPPAMTELNQYQSQGLNDYYWAANSKSFAKAVQGDVYVVIPSGNPINQPYDNKGSNWWSFEAPELTRNPNVQTITLVKADDVIQIDDPPFQFDGPNKLVWSRARGDDPLGYPADERDAYTLPDRALRL